MRSAGKILYTSARIAAQVQRMGREISRAYRGRTLDVVIVLESAFVFGADLVRQISVPANWHFVRVRVSDVKHAGRPVREIFFDVRPILRGRDVLLVDTVLQSGVTQEFLVRRLSESNPRSLRLAVLLDKPQERKVDLHPAYFGFRAASKYVVGYGLPDTAGKQRNLRFVAGTGRAGRKDRNAGKTSVRNPRGKS